MSEQNTYENIQWRKYPDDDGRYTWETVIDGIKVRATEPLCDAEANEYARRAMHLWNGVVGVNVDVEGEEAVISYDLKGQKIERIRRITGYLVGTLDRFNDAKRAEENERVKHKVKR